ncbi:MAG TPA: HAD-IB family hydrolase [Bacteroidales bacterium]|nr:HAD-IB family hydrolase [Bacteroidales bacterium]HPF02377.1 HAD-IB family hydrolase [Bacteroidales bacterium]HPJ58940.1 HAD-IB family hydrolase [Bacteroidales bacterium]HPR12194.1 HAD-IB family hydrolase [Bacteroidales bacterium]HRW84877.1 HAD-IB family hydrolase [Bacteroidales bacterium]
MENISSETNSTGKNYFAFFDLDHTITGSVSGKELVKTAYRKGMLRKSVMARAIGLLAGYRLKLVRPEKAIEKMGSWVKNIPVEIFEKLCEEVFSNVLKPSIYPQVKQELEFHRKRNAGLVMLSSTVTPLCSMMARHLGLDDTLCSGMEYSDGILTGKTIGKFCFGAEKAIRLKAYCEKNNSKTGDAWYYGDAMADLPALRIVGNPVCVNPPKKLRKIALKNGWKVYYWEK